MGTLSLSINTNSLALFSLRRRGEREREREMGVEGGRDIDDLPKNSANYTALTPLWFLERAAQVHPNRKSVIYGSKQYTWLQTYQRCRRLASALSRRSIGIGKTVSLIISYSSYLLFTLLYLIFILFLLIRNNQMLDCRFWCVWSLEES